MSVTTKFISILCLAWLLHLQIGHSFKVGNYLQNIQVTDNPDTYLPTPKIIRRHGYPAEAHVIQSEDGYLLELHRIPHGKNNNRNDEKKLPVLMHHGVLSTANDWVVNGPEKALGYMLADRGHDVWLANARGNTYSRGHVSLNPKKAEFWDFSFHESAVYDLPATIDYILEKTNNTEIFHIGHSMGTTIFYAMCSEKPEYNKKIRLHISLAPVARLTHTESYFKYLIPYAKQLQKVVDWYNGGSILENGIIMKLTTKALCGREIFNTNVCVKYILDSLFGTDTKELDQTILPVFLAHSPAGTSMKTLIHFAQIYSSNKFQLYDYGTAGNLRKYNQPTPPEYNLTKVTVPAALYYGKNDILAVYEDIQWLYNRLPSPVGLFQVKYDLFNHLDFIVSIDCNSLLNYPAINLINKTETPGFLEETVKAAIKQRSVAFGEQQQRAKRINHFDVSDNVIIKRDEYASSKFPISASKVDEFVRQYENRKNRMEVDKKVITVRNVDAYSSLNSDKTFVRQYKSRTDKMNNNVDQQQKSKNIHEVYVDSFAKPKELNIDDLHSPIKSKTNDNNNNNDDDWNEKFGDLFHRLESVVHRARP